MRRTRNAACTAGTSNEHSVYVSDTDSTTIPTTNSNATTNPWFDAAATTTVSKFP